MSYFSTRWPTRHVTNGVVNVTARYAGGGAAADMTKVAGRGVTSVAYTAATGAYTITFADVGETFLGGSLTVNKTAGTTATAKVCNSVVYSATAKTLTIFITDVATPTAKDLATTEELWIDLKWSDSDNP